MKTILGALALVLAAPVAAQSGAPADAHADHARHEQQQQQGEGHEGHECCCEKMKQEGQAMACCDKHGETSADAQPSPTEQHKH